MDRTTPADVSPTEKKIREMVRRIVEQFAPEKIILFGSHARGDADPDSDVDLLIVMPITGSKRDRTIEIRKALAGMGLAKDVIVATPEEIERYRDLVGTIIYPAVREGKLLYDVEERQGDARRNSRTGHHSPTASRTW